MNHKNNSLKASKRKNVGNVKNISNRKDGQLSLPGVGLRKLLKDSKKKTQKGGSRKKKSLKRNKVASVKEVNIFVKPGPEVIIQTQIGKALGRRFRMTRRLNCRK